MRKADGEDLVGAQGAISVPVFDDVVEAAGRGIPEARVKGCRASSAKLSHRASADGSAKRRRKVCHDAQSVVPQRLDLDRLADARRDYIVADFGVHPR